MHCPVPSLVACRRRACPHPQACSCASKRDSKRDRCNHILFPCPGPMGKGILVQKTLWGNLILGPTARDVHAWPDPETDPNSKEEVRAPEAPLHVETSHGCGASLTHPPTHHFLVITCDSLAPLATFAPPPPYHRCFRPSSPHASRSCPRSMWTTRSTPSRALVPSRAREIGSSHARPPTATSSTRLGLTARGSRAPRPSRSRWSSCSARQDWPSRPILRLTLGARPSSCRR